MNPLHISFAGAGRVGKALCREMFLSGNTIDLIVSKTGSKELAGKCSCSWSKDLIFPDSTNLIIVAVPDHYLKSVLNNIICRPEALIVHTAGSIGIDVFPELTKYKGVLYPLQTFSKERQPNFKNLPFFIESSDTKSGDILKNLAESIGGKAYFVDTEHRILLHLAAVFANNFTNHMLTIGKDLATRAGSGFEVLEPLIKETISKALDLGPELSQTGPAERNDYNTIEKHMELLSFSPELQKIYNELTVSIMKFHKRV
jgi:predicted short-subunit dehydrogenase-like oxidoreductase (DUF2520 family)